MATKLKEPGTGTKNAKFDVGGLLLDRPFKIRRLGHFGLFVNDMPACLRFYDELLGFAISDPLDFSFRIQDPAELAKFEHRVGFFMRHGTDHHSFVLFPKDIMNAAAGRPDWSEVTINQITWQVGSLREVTEAVSWFDDVGVKYTRTGRDTPGSNWHVYPMDPDRNVNELYYGIEQIGWEGRSKPNAMYTRGFREAPALPQINEYREVADAAAEGIDLASGYKHEPRGEATHDVGGILLPRPFKVTKIGPVRLFVGDVDASVEYYRGRLGLAVTEEVTWSGHRCVFLRANTEHHSIALYPRALRSELGLKPDTTLMSFGMQVAEYGQLRDAVAFLEKNGVEIRYLPHELFPGIDYTAFAIDPEGHAIQLYDYMEQVGWDGRPRPADQRRRIADGAWPETLEPMSDSYGGEAYMGPWG